MSLFTPYEERPPFCQAVLVWFDTVDDIAAYYSEGGYATNVQRTHEAVALRIFHEATERQPGCDLTVELPRWAEADRFMLVYGHPPTLVPEREFRARWREAKELP